MMNDPMDLLESRAEKRTAPLPDPWPGMIVDYNEHGTGQRMRKAIDTARELEDGWVFFCLGSVSTPWTPDYVREVRSLSGAVLWRRE